MHPHTNNNIFKDFIFAHKLINIFMIFIGLYFILSVVFFFLYYMQIDTLSVLELVKFSIFASFGFNSSTDVILNNMLYITSLFHQIIALLISTIFTSAIVLKYFLHPAFFVFKKRCNLFKTANDEQILAISLYNSSQFFVTNFNVRIYGRVESIDGQGTKALKNINNNQPIFEKTFPFMEQHLVTRLRIEIDKNEQLKELFDNIGKKSDDKLDLILLIEANVNKLDSSIYEVSKYKLDFNDIDKTIAQKEPESIELNYDDFSKSIGWDKFEN